MNCPLYHCVVAATFGGIMTTSLQPQREPNTVAVMQFRDSLKLLADVYLVHSLDHLMTALCISTVLLRSLCAENTIKTQ